MKIYEVSLRRYDRRDGVSYWSPIKQTASSASSAVGRAIKIYMRGLTPKEKRDAAKQLEIKCVYLGQEIKQ